MSKIDAANHDKNLAGQMFPSNIRILNAGVTRAVLLLTSIYAVLGLDIYFSCAPPRTADTAMLG